MIGLGLAWFVYSGMENVKQTATTLVEKQLPSLSLARDIALDLSEQERILYEYYATIKPELYINNFLSRNQILYQKIELLRNVNTDLSIQIDLMNELKVIQLFSQAFHLNMSSGNIDWDLAREQLEKVTDQRRLMDPQLNMLMFNVNHHVAEGYSATKQQLSTTAWSVIIFSVGLFGISIVLGRYIRNYIELSISNERLAMFPQRNPNPVLTLNSALEVLYHNPATIILLRTLKLPETPLALLASEIKLQLEATKNNVPPVQTFQHHVNNAFLTYEIHWLKDQHTFDIHMQDITEQKVAEKNLHYKAYHHDLSGLKNRASFFLSVDILFEAQVSFSLVLVEVAHYSKLVGDFGLSGATDVICSVAYQLGILFAETKKSLNGKAELFHIADASFIMLIEDVNSSESLKNFLSNIENHFDKTINTPLGEMLISMQFGVTEYPRCSKNANDLLLHAQIAIDNNQQLPTVNYFDHQLGSLHKRKQDLNKRLVNAIGSDEFELVFQPQMHLKTEQLIGAECLIRWHSDMGVISPAEFIPLAEQSGFILPLGKWILEQACKNLAAWQAMGHSSFCLAVNISPRQFIQPGFVTQVAELLAYYHIPPHTLELEITEGMMMGNHITSHQVLNELKKIGVSLAIDDFGTGYSSLAYLRQFPVDKLKIDQSFIKHLHVDLSAQSIVLSICQLAKNLSLEIIAEGVEYSEQLEILNQYQCDVIQGYHYSKPLQSADFLVFLHQKVNTLSATKI
ncbi:Oxygen sensor protein DosP [Shewanella baltica]|nr:Oxygen sensor protein DosP [Shewanella baltica]